MKILGFIIVLLIVLLAVFVAANWTVLTTATSLSFVAFHVQAPLGIILLAIMVGIVLLFTGYSALLRASWHMESRKLNRLLQEQRDLAQQAETSRFVTLQELVKSESADVRKSVEETTADVRKSIEETSADITAHLGYLDDKLKGDS